MSLEHTEHLGVVNYPVSTGLMKTRNKNQKPERARKLFSKDERSGCNDTGMVTSLLRRCETGDWLSTGQQETKQDLCGLCFEADVTERKGEGLWENMNEASIGDVWESRWTASWALGFREANDYNNAVHWQGASTGLGSVRGRGRVVDEGVKGSKRVASRRGKCVHKRDKAENPST